MVSHVPHTHPHSHSKTPRSTIALFITFTWLKLISKSVAFGIRRSWLREKGIVCSMDMGDTKEDLVYNFQGFPLYIIVPAYSKPHRSDMCDQDSQETQF